jgi:hypothetical protein
MERLIINADELCARVRIAAKDAGFREAETWLPR